MNDGKTICAYCGGKGGDKDTYMQSADALGKALGENHYRLVYGGGGNGMMGAVSNAVMQAGGEVIGVIPEFLREWEVANENITRLIVTETMHERKKIMVDYASAFVFLPGGVGTLDELFETLSWHTLRLHDKPMILLNVENYWGDLLDLLAHVKNSGFLHGSPPPLQVADSVGDAMRLINEGLKHG